MRMILDYDAQTKGISVGEESVLPEAHSSSRDELLELHYKVGVLTKGHGPWSVTGVKFYHPKKLESYAY